MTSPPHRLKNYNSANPTRRWQIRWHVDSSLLVLSVFLIFLLPAWSKIFGFVSCLKLNADKASSSVNCISVHFTKRSDRQCFTHGHVGRDGRPGHIEFFPLVKHRQLKSNFLSCVPVGRVSATELQYRGVWHIFIFIQSNPNDSDLICLVASSWPGLLCSSCCVRATSSTEDAVTVKAGRPGGSRPHKRRTSLSVPHLCVFVSLWTVTLAGRSDVTRLGSSGETLLDKRGSHRKWRGGKKDVGEAYQTRRGERLWHFQQTELQLVGLERKRSWDPESHTRFMLNCQQTKMNI